MKTPAYQLRIGVSGHREVDDIEAIVSAIKKLLTQLKDLVDDRGQQASSSVEFAFVSSLAIGADQLVTKEAVEILGAEVEFVSPFAIEEYKKDFDVPEEREQFMSLVEMDLRPTILNLNEGDKTFPDGSDQRKRAYLDAGQYVVDNCEILIVLWDGQPAKGVGGTGDVVEYAMKRNRTTLWLNANDPIQPVQRLRPALSLVSNPVGCQPFPFPESVKQLSLGFHRYQAFVQDSIVPLPVVEEAADEFLKSLELSKKTSGIDHGEIEHANELTILMSKADQMAIAYQKLYVFAANSLFRLSALAVSIAVFQVLFLPHQLWIIAFEIAAMLVAAGLLTYSRREAWHEKWLNDRYIAEWLRTRLYVGVLGQQREPAKDVENPLPFYTGPDEWFRSVFSSSVVRYETSMRDIDFSLVKRFLIDQWIRPQADWHVRNSETKESKASRCETSGTGFFALTILMATLHLFGVGHKSHDLSVSSQGVSHTNQHVSEIHLNTESQDDHPPLHDEPQLLQDISLWITFFAIVLPAWGAANHAIASMLEYDRIATRSAKMSRILYNFADRAERCHTRDDFVVLIEQTCNVIETENREWMVSLSFQGLKLPA